MNSVIDEMSEGLYVVDECGAVTMMNAAASRLLGWTEADLWGHRLHDVVHHHRVNGTAFPAEECELARAYREGRELPAHQDVFMHKDGSAIPVACSVAPMTDGHRAAGAVVAFRELDGAETERQRARRDPVFGSWVRMIEDALVEDRLTLFAQPIVPLGAGAPGEELLLRMIDRNGDLIAPGSFLPVAEKCGLIREIDCWVVSRAIDRAASGHRVDVNLSASSVGDPDLLALIADRLSETGAEPSDVVFEIAETALMHDIDAGEAFARGLTKLGCELALDDFGTGFASFTYLKRLPISYLKIDIEFVRQLSTSTANQHLVRAVVGLARGFGHRTIAEGVQDDETLALLRCYGVDFAQGFHLGRPGPLSNGTVPGRRRARVGL